MRPVARIAQSVEQGIENPRVQFDSESGHHYLKNPPKRRVFAFSASGLFIELRSITRSCPAALRLRGPTLFEPAKGLVGRIRHLCRHPAQPSGTVSDVYRPAALRLHGPALFEPVEDPQAG